MFNNVMREKYPELTETEPSSNDHEMTDQLLLLFNQLLSSAKLLVDHILTLEFNEYDNCSGDYQEEDKIDITLNIGGINYFLETMSAIVEFSKSSTFPTLRRLYRQIKLKEQLRRMKQYVTAQGTKSRKLELVDDVVYTEFIRSRECHLPKHGSDLRRLAFKIAQDLNTVDFTESHQWLLKSAENFVKRVRNTISDFAEDHALNSRTVMKAASVMTIHPRGHQQKLVKK
ncbi:unnamed protein product [Adineta ricciae]|uniref:Uncharacterized protein n=1 Tax=Adineta ricciae TaxID=249248 RepID=A0A816FZA1_ADIRI|nr:unnamed protein product [Adineta ricciae]